MENQKDELSVALRQMQDNLKKVADEHAERIWLQSARYALYETLRGGRSFLTLISRSNPAWVDRRQGLSSLYPRYSETGLSR
jgi:hypothetical protein